MLTNHWQNLPSTNNIIVIGTWGDFEWVENDFNSNSGHIYTHLRDDDAGINTPYHQVHRMMMENGITTLW